MSKTRYRICTFKNGHGQLRYTAQLKSFPWWWWTTLTPDGYIPMYSGLPEDTFATREEAEKAVALRKERERADELARTVKVGCEEVQP